MNFKVGDVFKIEGELLILTTAKQTKPIHIDRSQPIAGELSDFMNGHREFRFLKIVSVRIRRNEEPRKLSPPS